MWEDWKDYSLIRKIFTTLAAVAIFFGIFSGFGVTFPINPYIFFLIGIIFIVVGLHFIYGIIEFFRDLKQDINFIKQEILKRGVKK